MWPYTWDPEKSIANLRKHGIAFEEADTVRLDPHRIVHPDVRHDDDDRFLTIGYSTAGRLLLVVTSERGVPPRIISAWRATKRERREYEQR